MYKYKNISFFGMFYGVFNLSLWNWNIKLTLKYLYCQQNSLEFHSRMHFINKCSYFFIHRFSHMNIYQVRIKFYLFILYYVVSALYTTLYGYNAANQLWGDYSLMICGIIIQRSNTYVCTWFLFIKSICKSKTYTKHYRWVEH